MIDFVSIEDSLELPEVIIQRPLIEPLLETLIYTKEPIKLDISKDDEEHLVVRDDFHASSYYGSASPEGFLRKDNLFSELTTDYLRAVARRNLGIGEAYALVWGNITGNLVNLTDLYNFVSDLIKLAKENLRTDILQTRNEILTLTAEDLSKKANIDSPYLTGNPKAVSPSRDDNSERIATTAWVLLTIEAASLTKYITDVKCTPAYIFKGDSAVDVTISWDYVREIDAQWFDGTLLDLGLRSITIQGVNTDRLFTITYELYGTLGIGNALFKVYDPIYYGTSSNHTLCSKTINTTVEVNASDNKYIYILIPNGDNWLLSVNGFTGGFILESRNTINGTPYCVYRSSNKNLGQTTINLTSND